MNNDLKAACVCAIAAISLTTAYAADLFGPAQGHGGSQGPAGSLEETLNVGNTDGGLGATFTGAVSVSSFTV